MMRTRILPTFLLTIMSLGLFSTAALAQEDNVCHFEPTSEECVDVLDEQVDVEDEAEDAEELDATALPTDVGGDELARTGTDIATLSLVGAGLLIGGAGLAFAVRRRGSTQS